MKKVLAIVLTVIMLISAGVIGVFAARGSFTDADGDGVCDNALTARKYVDENNDGICDNLKNENKSQGTGIKKGTDFIDADEDGVCDNRGTDECKGKGYGRQGGRGFGNSEANGNCKNRGMCRRGR